MPLGIGVGSIRALLKELESPSAGSSRLAVGGARELAGVLRREFERDAAPGAVAGDERLEGATALVYVLGREPGDEDEQMLRRASRAGVPVVAVVVGPLGEDVSLPYVLATDVVRVGAGEGFPVETIAAALAARLGEAGAPLAARVPVLRRPVCDALIASFARKNGLVAAAVFVRKAGSVGGGAADARPKYGGADRPLLTLNQLRLVLRIAQAHGEQVGRDRLPELAAVVGSGVGLRSLARELLDLVPPAADDVGRGLSAGRRRLGRRRFQRIAGWAVKGAVAYAGTRALGEAAVRRFEAGVGEERRSSPATPPRA